MIFDGHGDILTDVMEQARNGIDIWNEYHSARYKQAGVSNGIFVNFTNPEDDNQKAEFDEITKVSLPYFKSHPDFNVILNSNDFVEDKFNLILGIEGMGAVDSYDQLDELYANGYRHIGITWNEKNNFASGTTSEGRLTSAGVELIKKCNHMGMIVDFAHLNYDSFMDACAVTTKPIFFSHGNARAVCDHVRNLDDKQLQLLKDSNGVIGLAVMRFFLTDGKENASIDDVIKHILYIKDNFGIDYVGFGFDFCYYLGSHDGHNKVEGLQHIDDAKAIISAMQAAGLNDEEIEKVCYKNMLRVVKEHLN